MLSIFKESFRVNTPVDGFVVKIGNVSDRVFSKKIIGDGIAVRAMGDFISSPIDGRIRVIFDTNHAFVIEAKNGIEILVHIGIDTIELNGEGFERIANEGMFVKAGDPIIKIDRKIIEVKEKEIIVPIIITNSERVNIINYCEERYVRGGQDIILAYKVK